MPFANCGPTNAGHGSRWLSTVCAQLNLGPSFVFLLKNGV